MKLTIYLAGWSQEKEYRRISIEKYGNEINFLDPMTITRDQVMDKIGMNEFDTYLIRRDKKMIDQSDILVAYISSGFTAGTSMEIMYAYCKGIPVYVIDPNEEMIYGNDAWIKFHTKKLFNSLDECFYYILNK